MPGFEIFIGLCLGAVRVFCGVEKIAVYVIFYMEYFFLFIGKGVYFLLVVL